MKQYKILKDSWTLNVKAGTIFTKSSDYSEYYGYEDNEGFNDFYLVEFVENNNDFEELKPACYTKNDVIAFVKWRDKYIDDSFTIEELLDIWTNQK